MAVSVLIALSVAVAVWLIARFVFNIGGNAVRRLDDAHTKRAMRKAKERAGKDGWYWII